MESVRLSASKLSRILKQKRVPLRQAQVFGFTPGEQLELVSGGIKAIATVNEIEYGHPDGMAALVVSHIIIEVK